MFRRYAQEHSFEFSNGVKFNQMVTVNTEVTKPTKRFGIDQHHVDGFIEQLLTVEINGRKFRTNYQIPMADGAPQAENFLWTILGNKVGATFLKAQHS